MRLSRPLAWTLVLLGVFTAGLLRQFNEHTPASPFVNPAVGSLLFAAVFFLLLVSAWERRRGGVRGPGIRLGSLTPLLLMLLAEKWLSHTFYGPLFDVLVPLDTPAPLADAQFRTLAGAGLLLFCLFVAPLSWPALSRTWRRARPSRVPTALVVGVGTIGGTYLCAMLLALVAEGEVHWKLPDMNRLWMWIVAGQVLLAVAEELYYRGLLLAEIERLAPRLGARQATARRWVALSLTAFMFGLEHVAIEQGLETVLRQSVFTISLGLLFGLLVLLSGNLQVAAGLHAWFNCLLLGAVPYVVDADGQALLPPGPYVGLGLLLAFGLAVGLRLRKHGRWARHAVP